MTTNRDGESLGIVSEVFIIRNKLKKHPTSKSEEILNETLRNILKKLMLALSMNSSFSVPFLQVFCGPMQTNNEKSNYTG